jgi:hypothetical protein
VTPVTPGTVTLQIFRGTPDTMLDMAPLAGIELDPMSLPDTTMSEFVELVPMTPVAVKAGDPITFVLGIDSTSTAMIAGLLRERLLVPTLMPEHKTWTRPVYPPGVWSSLLRSHLAIDVKMQGCF